MPPTRRVKRHHSRIDFYNQKGVPSQPDIPPPRETVHPGADFYTFVNGNWLRHINMLPYLSSYGVSEEIEDNVNIQLNQILHQSREIVRAKPDRQIPHTTYLLGTLTESALNIQTQDLNVKFVKTLVSSLRCIRDMKDIGHTLGEFIKYRVRCLFSFIVVPSEQDSKVLRLTITPGELGLPDPAYYKEDGSGKKRIIAAYSGLLKRLGEEFDWPNLEQIVPVEYKVADALVESRGDEEVIMKGAELLHTYSAIPWAAIFETTHGWSLSRVKEQSILVLSKRWLKHVNHWCKHLTLDLWKTWLASSILLHLLPLLPPPYDDLEFQLFGKRLRGQSEKMPQKRLALRLAQEWLTGSLGYEYVKRFVKPKVKSDALSIAEEIRAVAAERAGATEWLESATRKIASNKVSNIYLGVGYPKAIQKDQKTLLDSEQLIKNVLRLSELDFQDEMKKVNTPLRREQWEDAVFAVNAYYYNEGNRLILPSGILQWPFFDVHASDGWNFGGLGATIGHEICHAFDNDGKDYDQFGNRNPWWSRAESNRYREKTNALIELYNRTEYFGHKLNGFLTLSENIADLGGVAIALAALKKRLQTKRVSPQVFKTEICNFFISFAVSWRTKEKKEKAIQSLFMDVHAPPQARVNNIVSQFDEWYECFDIQPGNVLYKALEKRIRIF